MKTVIKPVYYCDYCKKRGLSKFHMEQHEKKCTANPDRQCGMCGYTGTHTGIRYLVNKYKDTYEPIPNLPFDAFRWKDKPVTAKMLLEDTQGCPACALSVIRLAGLNHVSTPEPLEFNFGYEQTEFWKKNNEDTTYHY